MSGRRVLIVGGAGFLGSHLCDAFLREGDTVVCADNLATGRATNVAHLRGEPRFSFVDCDVTETPLAAADLVLHLASPASPVHYQRLALETLNANSAGTLRLLEVARAAGAAFIYFSTSEVYGDPLVHPQPEDYRGNVSSTGPRACYDEAKRFGEALTVEYRRRYGVRTTILRLFNTYGPRMEIADGRAIPAFIGAALRREPLPIQGTGQQTRSLCYVDDLVRGVLAVAERPLDGEVLNIGNPAELTVLELAREVCVAARVLPCFRKLAPAPDDPARRCPDIRKMRMHYGWEPRVPLREGLERTVRDFRQRMGVAEPEAVLR